MFSDPALEITPYIEMKNGNQDAVKNDPLPTEIKVGENGQLTLF